MSVFPIHHQKRPGKSVLVTFPFLRHLNMGTLALVLFVALTLLNTVCNKGPATMESALAKASAVEVSIDSVSFSPRTFTFPVGGTVTSSNQGQRSLHLDEPR